MTDSENVINSLPRMLREIQRSIAGLEAGQRSLAQEIAALRQDIAQIAWRGRD